MKVVLLFVALLVFGAAIAEESLQNDVLSRSLFETKVTKGTEIGISTWNSIGGLHRGTAAIFTHYCSCSILTANYILSAAQCFKVSLGTDWSTPARWRLRVGLGAIAANGATHQLAAIVKHPNWNPNSIDNDIVVVRTTQAIILGPNVGQVILPPPGASIPEGSRVRVAGWGTKIGGLSSPTLLAGDLHIVDQRFCRDVYGQLGGNVTERTFCTRLPSDAENGCVGDIGSPLMVNNVLTGLVSWGYECVEGGYPGVNTQISPFTMWIFETARSTLTF